MSTIHNAGVLTASVCGKIDRARHYSLSKGVRTVSTTSCLVQIQAAMLFRRAKSGHAPHAGVPFNNEPVCTCMQARHSGAVFATSSDFVRYILFLCLDRCRPCRGGHVSFPRQRFV